MPEKKKKDDGNGLNESGLYREKKECENEFSFSGRVLE